MRYSSRFFLYAPFVGLLLLAVMAMTNWWFKATALAARLDAINGHEIMPGVRLGFSERRLAGFPFRIDTILKNLRVEMTEIGGPVVWTSEGFALHALAYGRVQAILEAGGRQTLSWRDANGGAHSFAFLPGTFRASALLQQGKLIRFDSEIVDLDGAEFRAANAQLHARAMGDGLDIYFKMQNARVSGSYARSLGHDITSLVASGRMTRGSALVALLRGTQAPEAALEDWRQADGTIAVSDLSVRKAAHRSSFAGNLRLDDSHDLAGTLHAKDGSTLRFDGNRLLLVSGSARP